MKRSWKRRAIVSILAAAVLLAAAVFYPKERAYRAAVRLQEQGKSAEAYRKYVQLGGWRDSAGRASALREKDPRIAMLAAQKWDTVFLGHCEQDADPSNGAEPLEWIVLDREEEEDGGAALLLLCRDCISCTAYHKPVEDITWERSTLRAWLNGSFLQETFEEEEQALIAETRLENPGNDLLGIDGGPVTEDAVFLLSAPEFSVYFSQEDARWLFARAQASLQARAEGIYLSGDSGREDPDVEEDGEYARWWLRSPGNEAYSAQFVEEDGRIFEGGAAVDIDYMYGLRPAVWVHLAEPRTDYSRRDHF
ncbi:MAG: DUF6273 domain-containing protein [Eubacteriales bacterium]|nr:DUF6273 domain-containing protein [Eubacteriales bacterium]